MELQPSSHAKKTLKFAQFALLHVYYRRHLVFELEQLLSKPQVFRSAIIDENLKRRAF
jgi:hypothetical protein